MSDQAAGAGTPPPAGAPPASGDWTTGFSEDTKGYVQNKGWKAPTDLVDSYRGLEKLVGQKDKLALVPDRFYDDKGKLTAEGRSFRERFGALKEAKEYDLPIPKEGSDPALTEHFRNTFFERGISREDAKAITESWNSYIEAQRKNATEAQGQKLRDEQASLAKEWGAATEQNTNLARDAYRNMGFKPEQVEALSATLGHAETMKLFHKLGTQIREAPFIGGQRQDMVLEPAQAKAEIKELRSDKVFGEALLKGDRDAQAKWERLHRQAFPGEVNL